MQVGIQARNIGLGAFTVVSCLPNNAVQAWHRPFQSNVGAHRPSFRSFVDVIKRQQSLFRTIVLQLRAGKPPTKRRRKYDGLDKRLIRRVSEYDATEVLEFYKSVAHNLVTFV
jgi:hypothetical protein